MTTPIATGERLVGVQGFRELLEKGACSVLQPDITHCGGLTEARRIAALAEAYRVALAPHNPQGPVSTAAWIELWLATPSYVICEAVTADVPWRAEVVSDSHRVDATGRHVYPSELPGLGVEIDLDVVRAHPFQPELPSGCSTATAASETGRRPQSDCVFLAQASSTVSSPAARRVRQVSARS